MRYVVLYIIFTLPCFLSAQSLSIEQLWQQLDDSRAYEKETLRVELQKSEQVLNRLDRLPLIYGDLNLQRNLIVPTTPVPAIAFDPAAPAGSFIPLRFATDWSSKVGAQLEWRLFDPSRKATEAEANLLTEKATISAQDAKQTWRREATLAYAAIVLASAQYEMAIADSSTYAELLRISRDRYEAGRETQENYLDAQQQMERKKIQLAEAWSVLLVANIDLARYADVTSFTKLNSGLEHIISLLKSYEPTYYGKLLADVDKRLADQRTRDVRRQYLPTLSFNAYLGTQYFANELQLFNNQAWYGNSYANIALRLPISQYFQRQTALRQATMEGDLRKLDWVDEQQHEDITQDKRMAKLQAVEKRIAGLEHIVSLCVEKKAVLLTAFQAGKILLASYNVANSEYIKAQQELWQAQYDWIDNAMK